MASCYLGARVLGDVTPIPTQVLGGGDNTGKGTAFQAVRDDINSPKQAIDGVTRGGGCSHLPEKVPPPGLSFGPDVC